MHIAQAIEKIRGADRHYILLIGEIDPRLDQRERRSQVIGQAMGEVTE